VRHALLTGFPGFIGRRLARRLLDEQPELRLTALVEARTEDVARRTAATIGRERLEVVVGDIAERHLGLSDHDHNALSATVDVVFHLAAIYDLAVSATLAQRVNVEGTGNVIEFCAGCERLERHVYVSTAYVAGTRTGTVYEHELVLGQGFKNHYEATKFQAEVWVHERMDAVPTTVLRPAIVVGDSRTGETEKFDGPYYILRMISQAERAGRRATQLGRSDAPFNVVPVDYVVDAMSAAAQDPRMVGETLHLVDIKPLSARDLVDLLSIEYAGRPTRGRVPTALVSAVLSIPALRARFVDTPPESIAYLNHPVSFDTRRAVDLLGRHGLAPPRFESYVKAMVDFFRAHERDAALVPAKR